MKKIILISISIFWTINMIMGQSFWIANQNFFSISEENQTIEWSPTVAYSIHAENIDHMVFGRINLNGNGDIGLGYSVGYAATWFSKSSWGFSAFIESKSAILKERTFPFYDEDPLKMLGFAVGGNILVPLKSEVIFLQLGAKYERLSTKQNRTIFSRKSYQPGIGILVRLNRSNKESSN